MLNFGTQIKKKKIYIFSISYRRKLIRLLHSVVNERRKVEKGKRVRLKYKKKKKKEIADIENEGDTTTKRCRMGAVGFTIDSGNRGI